MPLSEIIHSHGALIGLWEMKESEQELLGLLPDPDQYHAALNRFVSQKRRLEFLTIRVMLNQLMDHPVTICYAPSGKPYLSGSDYRISISHTAGYATLILHPHYEVAIDIEQRSPKVMRLQSKFMNQAELDAMDVADPLSYTLICWSAKETLFKIIDQPGIDFKENLILSPFVINKPSGYFRSFFVKNKNKCIFGMNYKSTYSYILTWIVNDPC